MKTKREMREAAIKRLRGVISNQSFVMTLCADDITKPLVGDGWSDSTVEEDAKTIIDLLTDDDDGMGDYIKLPRDANGEVIELWDKITYHGPCKKYQDRVFEVRGYGARAGRSIDSVVVRCDSHLETLAAGCCKHYKKPTVEDVLREFSDEVQRCCDTEDTIAEYAKMLQLKEDE